MGVKLTFNQAMARRESSVHFKMRFTGLNRLVDCVADSAAHRDLILARQPRHRYNVDNNGLITGSTISFTKKGNLPRLGYSIPAALHGVEYQNATRVRVDIGDFRKSNYRKVKNR